MEYVIIGLLILTIVLLIILIIKSSSSNSITFKLGKFETDITKEL